MRTYTAPTEPEPLAERRDITVMFCDLVGSTALSELLDPEAMLAVLGRYESEVRQAVERQGGVVAKHLGDGVLAWFGYPTAHEDDARRAIRAGLQIVKDVPKIPTPVGFVLRARVGIHGDLVVVGGIGVGRELRLDVVGRAPNIAARIQDKSEPGDVLISGSVRARVGAAFAFRSLGAIPLKGVDRPMSLFRVEAENPSRSRFRIAASQALTPLTGRKELIAELWQAWREASAGETRFVRIVGDAGIGKSRLVQAFQAGLADVPHRWLEAHASPELEQSPFGALLDAAPEAAAAALEEGPPGDTPQRRRRRIEERLRSGVIAQTQSAPSVLAIEDAHWLDPSSRELLGELVRTAPNIPLLVIVTSRPLAVDPWPRAACERELLVDRLSAEDAALFVDRVPDVGPLSASARATVLLRAEGVPLFLEELARAAGSSYAAVPGTVQDILSARLDSLGPDRRIAQVGACIGREFDFEVLDRVAAAEGLPSGGDLVAALDRLVAAGLLAPRHSAGGLSYIFRHALLSDAARASLLHSQRRLLHASIATALAELQPQRCESHPEALARQLGEAGRPVEAADRWCLAARNALQRSANLEALTHVEEVFRLLPSIADAAEARRVEIAARSAETPARIATSGYAATQTGVTLLRLRDLSLAAGDAPSLLAAYNGLWSYFGVRGDLDDARASAEAIVPLGEAAGLPALAEVGLGLERLWRGEWDEALQHFDAGAARYDKTRHKDYVAIFGQDPGVSCLIMGALALVYGGETDAGRLERGINLADELGNAHSQVFALQTATWIAHLRGDIQACLAAARRTRARAQEESFLFWDAMAAVYERWALAALSPGAAGVTDLESAIAAFRTTGDRSTLPYMEFLLADARIRSSLFREAHEGATRALEDLGDHSRWFLRRLREIAEGGAR